MTVMAGPVLTLLAGLLSLATSTPTIFGIRIVDAPQSSVGAGYGPPPQPQYKPSYQPPYKPSITSGLTRLKAGALRGGANALRFKVSNDTAAYTTMYQI